jgi:hypothetical protein
MGRGAEVGMCFFMALERRNIGLEKVDPKTMSHTPGFRRVCHHHGGWDHSSFVCGVVEDGLGKGAKV